MDCRKLLAGAIVVGVCALAPPAAAQWPVPDPAAVPPRTSFSFRTVWPGLRWGTANETEPRAGLSLVKLYIVDYALRHGDGSAADVQLGERMIRYSDDGAADGLAAKYPVAIDRTAAEYHLPATRSGPTWGESATSAADVSDFLEAKLRNDPNSPILRWMAEAGPVAADGTVQDWGTSHLPGVIGTKWGWSDVGPSDVGSTSYGPGFSVTAHTHGTGADQTADVLGVLAQMLIPNLPHR